MTWLVAGWFVIVHPKTDRPTTADAILVLGPSLHDRLAEAVRLAGDHNIRELVVSVGDTPVEREARNCVDAPATVTVTCFVPDPYTTRGEAREIGRLAAARHWHTVIVIGPQPQLSRARYLIARCFGGRLEMVRSPDTFEFGAWVQEFIHQSGGFAKAELERGC